MKPLSAPQLRNVAVVGHNTVGKTTLVAALLHAAGATTRPGRIEDGTCPTDFDAEEIDRERRGGGDGGDDRQRRRERLLNDLEGCAPGH